MASRCPANWEGLWTTDLDTSPPWQTRRTHHHHDKQDGHITTKTNKPVQPILNIYATSITVALSLWSCNVTATRAGNDGDTIVSWRWMSSGLNHRPDGGSKYLWNVSKLLSDYTALQPRWQPFSYSPPGEPEILLSVS
jgi:hypothetical protein